MDAAYDPDDQFFQAFKAGYLRYRTDRPTEAHRPVNEQGMWDHYLGWLKGDDS